MAFWTDTKTRTRCRGRVGTEPSMKMSDDDREHLYGTLGTLQEMVEGELIDPQWYHKALVDGAHQHLIAKELGNAITLLGKVPASYYSNVLSAHMTEDACYADQVFEI